MKVATRDAERLIAATDQVSLALDDLLEHLHAADRMLRTTTGRIGPALLGGLESAAETVRAADQRRERAAAVLAERSPSSEVSLAALVAFDGPWVDDVLTVTARLHRQIAEVDQVGSALRRTTGRPSAVAGSRPDAQRARRLLRDALHQRLNELVPLALRRFLPVAEPTEGD